MFQGLELVCEKMTANVSFTFVTSPLRQVHFIKNLQKMSKTGGLICLVLQARLVFIKWFHKLSITIKDDRYVVQQIYKKEHHCNNTVSQVVISLTHTHYHTHIID